MAQRGFEAIEPSPVTTLVPRLVWEGKAPSPTCSKESAKALAEPLNSSRLPGIAGCNRLKRQLHKKQKRQGKTHAPTLPGAKQGGREAVSAARAAHASPGRTGPAPFPSRSLGGEERMGRRAAEIHYFPHDTGISWLLPEPVEVSLIENRKESQK